jgi:hypothetical protein
MVPACRATPWLVTGCAECIADEDHGKRNDVCLRLAPHDEQQPAARRLRGRLQRRRVRHDRILIEDELGYRWAELPAATGLDLQSLLADIDADLAVLPPIQFALRYRRWMTPRSPAKADRCCTRSSWCPDRDRVEDPRPLQHRAHRGHL